MRLVTKSTVKSGVVTLGSSARRRRDAAERGAEAREELAHAERLGDVVVGAGVERRDLLALRLARGEDDDGHVGPAAEAGDHVEPGDVGESEVEDDEVGPVSGRELERDLAGAGRVDVVAARAEVRDERAQDLRFVVDDEDACHGAALQRDDGGRSSAGGVLELELAAHRRHEAARDCEAESDASAAIEIAQPLERLEDTIALGGRDAGTTVDDAQHDAILHRSRLARGPVGRVGTTSSAFSTRFAITRSRSTASPSTGARDSDTSLSTNRARSPRLASAAGTTSSRCTSRTIGSTAPACRRLMSSRLPDERVEAIGFVLDRREELVLVLLVPRDVRLPQTRSRGLDRRRGVSGDRATPPAGARLAARSLDRGRWQWPLRTTAERARGVRRAARRTR